MLIKPNTENSVNRLLAIGIRAHTIRYRYEKKSSCGACGREKIVVACIAACKLVIRLMTNRVDQILVGRLSG